MSRDDESSFLVIGMFIATTFWVLVFVFLLLPESVSNSHKALGSKDRACFANHTCRENLKCVYTEGLEPWSGVCVPK